MEYTKLNHSYKDVNMPMIGFGTNTIGKNPDRTLNGDYKPLVSALEVGYRLIDTAMSYGNETVLAEGLRHSSVPRDEICVISKLKTHDREHTTKEQTLDSFNKIMDTFGFDCMDLFLIHHPWEVEEEMIVVWKTILELAEQGRVAAPGVSNFNREQIELLYKATGRYPAVNQVAAKDGVWDWATIDFCLDKGITPIGWGPLHCSDEHKAAAAKIGENYGKSWAQVVLRCDTQQGICPIPKSLNPVNQAANLAVFDFSLTESEIQTLRAPSINQSPDCQENKREENPPWQNRAFPSKDSGKDLRRSSPATRS